MNASQNQHLAPVAQPGGVSVPAATGPHPGPPPFAPTVSGGAPPPLIQTTASPFHPVVLEAAAVAANPAAAAVLQQQPSPQMQNKGNLVNYAVQSQYSPMQSQMGSGHYGSRGSQQMPDQQAQNVMNTHRSNPAVGGVMTSKDGRQGGQTQNSLHPNENHQRGPKHGEHRNYRSISEGDSRGVSGAHHMTGSNSGGLGDRQNKYHSSMHVDHGTHNYNRAPQNYPSNQPRMFTSSQRKGGTHYYNQNQHPHQTANQQLAHNPANLAAASATGGGSAFRHHSPKGVQGFNDPRQSYAQHTQPYQITPSTFHASNQAGNQLAYQHLGSSVQPAPYMGRTAATGHFHDPQQHPSNVPPYPQHYPGAGPLVHGYPASGGYQGHHNGAGGGGGGYSNSYNSPRSYNSRNLGDLGRYDSGNAYYNNSYSSNGIGGNSSSSPTDTLNALAARYGIEAKFVVKEVEYLPQSNQNSSNQYDANTGISNVQTRGSHMSTGYRQGGGSSGYQRSPPNINSNYGSPYGIKFGAGGGHQGNYSGQYFSGGVGDSHTTPQNNRNRQIRSPRMYTVSLQIAGKEFIGQGRSQNQARNTAASSAVKEFQKNPLKPDDVMKYKRSTGASSSANEKAGSNSATTSPSEKEPSQNVNRTNTALKLTKAADSSTPEDEKSTTEDNSSKVKPDISQVYELAQRMNLPVVFEENFQEGSSVASGIHNGGPKSFTVKCKVGEHETEAQAHGKKYAHRTAARKMLEILNTLDVPPPRPRAPQPLYNSNPTSSAWRNAGRVNRKTLQQFIKSGPSGDFNKSEEEFLNPISRLVQILQLQKGKSPVFTVRSQINGRRSREFHVEVSVGSNKAEGHGSNKKAAKKQAAVNMLQSMGYTVESKRLLRDGEVIPPPEPKSNQAGSNRRVTFKDSSLHSSADDAGVLSGNISSSNLQPGMVHILSKSMMVASFGGVTAAGDASGVTEEAKQDMLDEQAGYVSATDFAVLERQRAMDAHAMFIKQRFWNQRQNAIKIAKEFHAPDMGSSETATKLLSTMGRSVASVINGNNPTADSNNDEANVDMSKPRHQMKILCFAVSAMLSFQDYTKVGQSNEHSTRLKMTLGKVFEIEASSSVSVDDARDKASQSALNLIANADPNSSPCYVPPSLAMLSSTALNLGGESTLSKDSSGVSPGNSVAEPTCSTPKEEVSVSNGANGDTQHSDSDNWAQGDNSTHVAGNETSAEHCSETITESPVAADSETSPPVGQSETSSRNEIYEGSRTNSAIGRNKSNATQQNTENSAVE